MILNEYKRLEKSERVVLFPSLRFEYFLRLLKSAEFIMGNSSAGIRESGIYGIPAIDIGTRQNGRYTEVSSANVQHVSENINEILKAVSSVEGYRKTTFLFGRGNSTQKFMDIVRKKRILECENSEALC